MKKRLIPIIAILALGGAALLAYRGWHREDNGRIAISGNIELTEINIAFKTAGKLIERTVDEGDRVKKGQVIARLDRDQLLAQREREQAGVLSARSQLTQAGTGVEYQKAALEGEIAQRRAEVEQADAKLNELRNGARPQEIQQADAMVESARTEADRAQKDWDRVQTLYKQDDISTAQYEQYRTRYESASAAWTQARENAAMVHAGPRAEVIAQAAAQVESAKARLRLAEASRLDIRRRQEELSSRRADIERARAQSQMVGSQIEDTVAVSPIDGVVLVKAADPGEVLAPGTAIVTVGDIQHPWMRGYVSERDLGRVKLGTKARITTDSYPGKVYWGRVSFIASEAEFTPKQIQTAEERVKLVYRIKIEVDNPNQELKLNMPVDAELQVEQPEHTGSERRSTP